MTSFSDVCIVIPLYNEKERIQTNCFVEQIKSQSCHFILVDDGSQDATAEYLSKNFETSQNVTILKQKVNRGKAEAVRQGFLEAFKGDYQYIGYFDADLSTPLTYVERFHDKFQNDTNLMCVLGCRLKRLGAEVTRSEVRHLLGRVFATLVSLLLKEPVYDTQCGAKLFKKEVFFVFNEKFTSRWLFDIELLFRLKNTFALSKVCYEYPLEFWKDTGNSRLKLKDFILIPYDLLRIIKRYMWT